MQGHKRDVGHAAACLGPGVSFATVGRYCWELKETTLTVSRCGRASGGLSLRALRAGVRSVSRARHALEVNGRSYAPLHYADPQPRVKDTPCDQVSGNTLSRDSGTTAESR